jgi:hypothetical protein
MAFSMNDLWQAAVVNLKAFFLFHPEEPETYNENL